MIDYKTLLLELLDKLPDKALKRIYDLAKYLYIYSDTEQKIDYADLINKMLEEIDNQKFLDIRF